ncbi:TrkA C-terminal domain-containing protein [Hydrocoleum sp. CS-953]|uniref:TrkA C-terminal domain-containing protein n=1 Tax=Hydrocoleum sp. CS-953 TaxID=1671698 RepID=UPI000B9B0EC8
MGISAKVIQKEIEEIRQSHYQALRPSILDPQISRELKAAVQDMNSRWYSLPENSPLTGMTLEETNLRRLTGVSLMAIRREEGEEIDYPEGQTVLDIGDKLLLVGEPSELDSFERLAKGEIAVPKESTSCQWLILTESSPFVGQKLSDVDLHGKYAVEIQAIQREGKLIRWPQGDTETQMGDRLLLCGSFHELSQIRQLTIPQSKIYPEKQKLSTTK